VLKHYWLLSNYCYENTIVTKEVIGYFTKSVVSLMLRNSMVDSIVMEDANICCLSHWFLDKFTVFYTKVNALKSLVAMESKHLQWVSSLKIDSSDGK
jgi:hypothetical protein